MAGICKTWEIKRDSPLIWERHHIITEQQILMANQVTPIGNKASTENKYTHQQYFYSLAVTVILATQDNLGTGSLY